MNTKVYVLNLSATTTESTLRSLFAPYGNVAEVNIVVDRANQKPRGFGCVTMATPEGAQSARRALNGKVVESCSLCVSEAKPREARTGSSDRSQILRRRAGHL